MLMLRNFFVLFFVLFFLFICTCKVTSVVPHSLFGTLLTNNYLSCTYDWKNSVNDFNFMTEPFPFSFSGSSVFYSERLESHFVFSTNFVSTQYKYLGSKSIYFVFNITFFSLNHNNSNSLKLFCACVDPELRSSKSTLTSVSLHPPTLAPNVFFKMRGERAGWLDG